MYYGNLTKIATKIINFNDTEHFVIDNHKRVLYLLFLAFKSMLVFLINCQFSLKREGHHRHPHPCLPNKSYFQFKFFTIILAGILKLTSETQPGMA